MAGTYEATHPLFIPKGSVRALVTLTIVGAVSYHLLHDLRVTDALNIAVLVVLAYYFAHRGASAPRGEPKEKARNPLYLPRGWIRAILVVGFVATGVAMWHRGLLTGSENRQTLTTLAAFFAGIGFSAFQGRRQRPGVKTPLLDLFNHGKALAVIAAAVLLGFSDVFGLTDFDSSASRIGTLSMISFYFGSR